MNNKNDHLTFYTVIRRLQSILMGLKWITPAFYREETEAKQFD